MHDESPAGIAIKDRCLAYWRDFNLPHPKPKPLFQRWGVIIWRSIDRHIINPIRDNN